MKASQILASALFGSFAAAAPFNKRALVTATEIVYETVIVYTTVWEDELPVAEATTTAGGFFYEQPASSVDAKPTTAAAPTSTPAAVQEPSSVYTPPVETSAVVVVSSAAPAPQAVETSSEAAPAAPTTTEAAFTPAPVPSAAPAPAPSAAPAPVVETVQESAASPSTGETFTGDLTINPLGGGALGACGETLHATDMVVALAKDAWGESTYDVMTGKATNPWCGQKININYNGKTVPATIMDLCPGCKGHDIDLSDAAWAAIGMTEWTRVSGSWSKAS